MDEILKKLDKMDSTLDSIQILQAVHTEQLTEHMRRSDLLERRIEQVDEELKPVEKHVTMVNGVVKFIGIVGTISAIILAIKELL